MSDRPYVSFAEVKAKVPIPDVLEVLGIVDGFNRKGDVLTGCCPLPQHQHGPSPNDQQFKINRKDGVWLWHCFGDCQRGGDVIELVKAMTNFDDAHVRFWFAEHFGDRLILLFHYFHQLTLNSLLQSTTCAAKANRSPLPAAPGSTRPPPLGLGRGRYPCRL